MILSPRLQTIADSINNFETLADIGTDHAYLPIYLIRKNSVKHAIATDINKGPIEIAENRIKGSSLQDKIETRMGSGLSVLRPKEADVVVVAGMGGMLIADIIKADFETAASAEAMVLQPMLDAAKLREYLLRNGFEITDEELVKEEHKLYEILWIKYTGKSQDIPEYLELGPKLIEKKHPLLMEFISRKEKELRNIEEKLKGIDSKSGKEKLNECTKLLRYYNEVKKWVQ